MSTKLWTFFLNHGLTLMITGLSIMVAGLLITIQQHYRSHVVRQVALGISFAGIVLYIFGRICVYFASRRSRKMREQAMRNSEEKDVS